LDRMARLSSVSRSKRREVSGWVVDEFLHGEQPTKMREAEERRERALQAGSRPPPIDRPHDETQRWSEEVSLIVLLDGGQSPRAPDDGRSRVAEWLAVGALRSSGRWPTPPARSDGVKLALAGIALFCCVLAIGYSSHFDRVVGQALSPAPHGVSWLITVVYDGGSYAITAALILLALVTRRWLVARDIGLAALGAVAISLLLIFILGRNGGRPAGAAIEGFYLSFPVIQLAVYMAVVTAALPYLARTLQRSSKRPSSSWRSHRWSVATGFRSVCSEAWQSVGPLLPSSTSSSAHHSAFLPLMMSMRCSLSCQSEPVRFGHWRSRPGGGHLPRHGDQRKGRRI